MLRSKEAPPGCPPRFYQSVALSVLACFVDDKDIIFNENVAGTVALPNNFHGNLQELDDQVNSMMARTENRNVHGQPIYQCTMCGKQAKNAHLKYHIEAKHLDGVSIPCNLCPNMFRSRSILAAHIFKAHKNI